METFLPGSTGDEDPRDFKYHVVICASAAVSCNNNCQQGWRQQPDVEATSTRPHPCYSAGTFSST